MNQQQNRDPELWQIAQRRASFKTHLLIYIVMSLFFWFIWYFTGGPNYTRGVPWPVWPMLGWGVGVAFHYIGAYVAPKSDATQREYDKLLNEKNKNSNI